MKINKYINVLKTERKELSDKYKEMQLSKDVEKKNNIKKRLIKTTEKLMFLMNLRNAIIDNELQNKRKK